MDDDNQNVFLLQVHLEACVPLRIDDYRRRGGPQDSDRDRVQGYLVPTDGKEGEAGAQSLLCAGAEAILFRTETGKSAEWVTKLVDALAVLSFVPGGVRAFGLSWPSAADVP